MPTLTGLTVVRVRDRARPRSRVARRGASLAGCTSSGRAATAARRRRRRRTPSPGDAPPPRARPRAPASATRAGAGSRPTGRCTTASPTARGISTTMPPVHGPAAGRRAAQAGRPGLRLADRRRRHHGRGHRERHRLRASTRSFQQVWKQHLGTPSPQEERPCGNIDPLGITGTPIYQRRRRSTSSPSSAATCGTSWSRSTLQTGEVNWQPRRRPARRRARGDMQQRGALAITGGRVWVPFGALAGDCGDYKGRVVGVNLDGTRRPGRSTARPPTRGGGIWNPAGPTRSTPTATCSSSPPTARRSPATRTTTPTRCCALDGDAQAGRLVRADRLGAEQPGRRRARLAGPRPRRRPVGRARRQVRPGVRAAPGPPRRDRRPGRRCRTSARPSAAPRSTATSSTCPATRRRRARCGSTTPGSCTCSGTPTRLDRRLAGRRRRTGLGARPERRRAARPRPEDRQDAARRSTSGRPAASRRRRSTASPSDPRRLTSPHS